MDTRAELSDSLFVRDSYLRLAASLGIATPLSQEAFSQDKEEREGGATHGQALALALEEAKVDLGTSRVRVGLSRGHLFELVVHVPLDVSGGPESLQVAAEIYCEARLGNALLDDWVACISIDRMARARGLLMLSDARMSAQHYPLEEFAELLLLGVARVQAELPPSLLLGSWSAEDWVALEIPPADAALQPERCFASTRFPEALKCALEGMPFSSRRFTKGTEAFSWLSWTPPASKQERLSMRKQVEVTLTQAQEEGWLLFAGSGFGPTTDYADLWVELETPGLPQLLRDLAGIVEALEFGLYDSPFSSHALRLHQRLPTSGHSL